MHVYYLKRCIQKKSSISLQHVQFTKHALSTEAGPSTNARNTHIHPPFHFFTWFVELELSSKPSIHLSDCLFFLYFLCFPPAREVFWSETSRDNHFVIKIVFNVTLCRPHYDLGYIYLKYIQITVPSVHELFLYNNYRINVCLI